MRTTTFLHSKHSDHDRCRRRQAPNLSAALQAGFLLFCAAGAAIAGPPASDSHPGTNPFQPAVFAKSRAPSARELYQETLKGTVFLIAKKASGLTSATGWVLDKEKGLVVTNQHVVAGATRIKVYFPVREAGQVISDPEHYLENVSPKTATLVDTETARDLALLRVKNIPASIKALRLASEGASVGERIHTVGGMPKGSGGLWGWEDGIVRLRSRLRVRGKERVQLLESDMSINPGNSGGPVVNARGEVVAVVQGRRTDANDVSLHVELAEIKAYLDSALPLLNPESAGQFMRRGKRHYDEGRYAEAVRDLSAAIRTQPDFADAYAWRGWAFYRKGDSQTALLDFNAAIKLNAAHAEAYYGRGVLRRKMKKYQDSITDLTHAIRAHPDRADLYNARGVSHDWSGKPHTALGDFKRAIEIDPKKQIYHTNLASVQQRVGRYDDALKSLSNALKQCRSARSKASVINRIGICQFRMKKYGVAAVAFLASIRLHDKDPVVHHNLGDALRQGRQYELALKPLSAAISLDPRMARAYYLRGICYRELKQYSPAIRDFSKAIAIEPLKAPYYFSRALTHKAAGDSRLADSDFKKAARIDPRTYPYRTAPRPKTPPRDIVRPSLPKTILVSNSPRMRLAPYGGKWKFAATVDGVRYAMKAQIFALSLRGYISYDFERRLRNGRTERIRGFGSCQLVDGKLVAQPNSGKRQEWKVRMQDGKLKLELSEWGFWFPLEKNQQ